MDPGESITLGALGAESLKQGIAFLYAQAGEILRRRERDQEAVATVEQAGEVLEADPGTLTIDAEALELLEPGIRTLAEALKKYAEGEAELDPRNPSDRVLRIAAGLRLALESVAGQRLTFRDEARPEPDVDISVEAERVHGYVAAIEATDLGETKMRVDVRAQDIGPGGTVIGYTDRGLPPRSR